MLLLRLYAASNKALLLILIELLNPQGDSKNIIVEDNQKSTEIYKETRLELLGTLVLLRTTLSCR